MLNKEQASMRHSFWLTTANFYGGKTFLDLFAIATSLLVYAHDEGAKRSNYVKVPCSAKTPWSEICKRYYHGLFVTLCLAFEDGPYVVSKKSLKLTLAGRQKRNNHYWLHFVPALFAFCKQLFGEGLFNPFVVWHVDNPHAFLSRENAKVSNHGIYSLDGYRQFLNSNETKDLAAASFLQGAYYPFVRILQLVHSRGKLLHHDPDFFKFRLTAVEKFILQNAEPLAVPWGVSIQPTNVAAAIPPGQPSAPKRRRLSDNAMLCKLQPLLGAIAEPTLNAGTNDGGDQLMFLLA
jgi:hypothetical protein